MNFPKEEAKSWTTRQSDVNPNTVIENLFLEEFVKNILADLHEGRISEFRPNVHQEKDLGEQYRGLMKSLFQFREDINLSTIVHNLSEYFMKKSHSFANGELNQLLQMKFSNTPIQYPTYKQNEILLVDVKIKAESEGIEKMPMKMKEMLISLQQNLEMEGSFNSLAQQIKRYKEQSINFMVIYFGYYDFSQVKNTHFEDQQIYLFGKRYKLRINAIFVSRVALMETFKTFCKTPNLEEIDGLLIQLYELKRVKLKLKRKRLIKAQTNNSNRLRCASEIKHTRNQSVMDIGVKAIIGIGAFGAAFALGKFFS